jgi:hypothetical protein
MILRFSYELAVGVITILSVIIFGEKGQAAFALLALLPVILRIIKFKPDERELALFYKSGNLTVVLLVAALFGLSFFGLEEFFMKNWMFISASALLISHGLSGLIVFKFY